MATLSARNRSPELLDAGNLADDEVRRALLDLRRVNRRFGSKRILLKALAREISRHSLTQFSVLDIASGSCDLPIAVLQWAQQRRLRAQVYALEYQHRHLALFRHEIAAQPGLFAFCADAFRAPVRDAAFDFVTCSHFLHHLTEEEALRLLLSMGRWARHAVIVNDLERHPLPYYFFRTFSPLFTTTRVSRIDGLLSLRQSFRREELDRLAARAGLAGYTVRGRWPFQLLLVYDSGGAA